MRPPKFAIGQTVYVMPVVNRTIEVADRYWNNDLKPQPGWVYKVIDSPAWFPEEDLKTHEEVQEHLEEQRYLRQEQPELFYGDDDPNS